MTKRQARHLARPDVPGWRRSGRPEAETGVDWCARVTGIGDDGRIYVQRLEVVGDGG